MKHSDSYINIYSGIFAGGFLGGLFIVGPLILIAHMLLSLFSFSYPFVPDSNLLNMTRQNYILSTQLKKKGNNTLVIGSSELAFNKDGKSIINLLKDNSNFIYTNSRGSALSRLIILLERFPYLQGTIFVIVNPYYALKANTFDILNMESWFSDNAAAALFSRSSVYFQSENIAPHIQQYMQNYIHRSKLELILLSTVNYFTRLLIQNNNNQHTLISKLQLSNKWGIDRSLVKNYTNKNISKTEYTVQDNLSLTDFGKDIAFLQNQLKNTKDLFVTFFILPVNHSFFKALDLDPLQTDLKIHSEVNKVKSNNTRVVFVQNITGKGNYYDPAHLSFQGRKILLKQLILLQQR